MQQESFGHNLNDLARCRAWNGGLKHRLMHLRVELVALFGFHDCHAMF